MIKKYIAAGLARFTGKEKNSNELGSEETRDYWIGHNVTMHQGFRDEQDSLEYFHWRNDQYFNCIELMPVVGQDDNAVRPTPARAPQRKQRREPFRSGRAPAS